MRPARARPPRAGPEIGGIIRFKPFAAWRPPPPLAPQVGAPPYDVVTRAEAARLADGNPLSFLHVGRAEIDLPPDVGPYDARVYATAKANLDRLRSQGALSRDPSESVYLYELVREGRSQMGVVGCVHVDDYAGDVIRKHEKTRRDKEDDRTRHVLTLNAHAEPVFLTFRDEPALDALLAAGSRGEPLYDFVADGGVRHRVWRLDDPGPAVAAFERIPLAYVADGHHRCASAWRAGMERRAADPHPTGAAEYNWFPAALFPASRLRILPYHRVVRDLNGLRPGEFLDRLRAVGRVVPALEPSPPRPGSVGVYLDRRWHLLVLDAGVRPAADPVRTLDAALLEERVLGPILGLGDIRTDPRVDFVGGIRGPAELERQVDGGGMAAAFALYPVTVGQLMAIADTAGIMPPKTTWFEPKLLSGLFVHSLD